MTTIQWETMQLKHIADVSYSNVDKHTKDGEVPVLLCNYTDVYKNNYITDDLSFMRASATQAEIEKFAIRQGDVILTKDSESWDDIAVPAYVSEAIDELICGYHLALVRAKTVDSKYLYWLFLADSVNIQLALSSQGVTRVGLGKHSLENVELPIPPLLQQKKIAAYLDNEVTKIDQLIQKLVDKQTGLLTKLQQKREALIAQAVTQGIDPSVPMRPSGVPWLGNIPAHWEVEYARWLFAEIDERSTDGNEELLSVSHLTGVTSRAAKNVNMFMAEDMTGYKVCQSGDLVINTLWAWMGAMGVSPQPGIVSPAYHVYRADPRHLLPSYIDYLVRMTAFAQEVTRYSKGVWSSRLRLYPEGFFEVQLPIPPLAEQHEIVNHIKAETEKIDVLQKQVSSTIELLQERRTALISAAVTGQLEVPTSDAN